MPLRVGTVPGTVRCDHVMSEGFLMPTDAAIRATGTVGMGGLLEVPKPPPCAPQGLGRA